MEKPIYQERTKPKNAQHKVIQELFKLNERDFAKQLVHDDNTFATQHACEEIHASLKIMAILNHYEGYTDLKPVEISEEDSDHTRKVKTVLNHLIENIVPMMKKHDALEGTSRKQELHTDIISAEQSSGIVAWVALEEGAKLLVDAGFKTNGRELGRLALSEKSAYKAQSTIDGRPIVEFDQAYNVFDNYHQKYNMAA